MTATRHAVLIGVVLMLASALAGCPFAVGDPYTLEPPGDCTDGIVNGSETDTDCGGRSCPACIATQSCQSGEDCESRVCEKSVCREARCSDGVLNGVETGVDCGGGDCPAC